MRVVIPLRFDRNYSHDSTSLLLNCFDGVNFGGFDRFVNHDVRVLLFLAVIVFAESATEVVEPILCAVVGPTVEDVGNG